MHTPKFLPWHARKAGVSDEHAASLWRKAVRLATAETGWVGTSEYWGAAMDHFLRLLEEESASLCAPRVTPLVRSQARMWRLPLIAIEDMVSAMAANWQRAVGISRRAA